jgi:thioredoxin-related protein
MKRIILILALPVIAVIFFAFTFIQPSSIQSSKDSKGAEKIEWITIQELNTIAQGKDWSKNKKKVFMDLYTVWCGWCKKMDANTFSNPAIAKYMNEHFYAIKFDAETKETIQFGDKEYPWVAGGRRGINQLTRALGVTGYPTVVFLNKDLAKLQAIPGYKDVNGMLSMLVYYAEDHYKNTPWGTFQQNFDPSKYK